MTEWNRDTPWRQGLILTSEACIEFNLTHPDGQDCTVVAIVTHDCDLTQHPSKEPSVEVMVGRRIDKLDSNCTHAKSARKLHIEFTGEVPMFAEFDATNKTCISKEALGKFYPQVNVSLLPDKYNIYQYWLASRYRRSAFPDAFERRLKDETGIAKKIAKALEPHGEHIIGIFFDVDEGGDVKREAPDDTYTLDIHLLHSSEPDFFASEAAAKQAADVITRAFKDQLYEPTKTWKLIELHACEVWSETTMTYQHFKQLKQWRLDYISFASDPQQPVLAA